MHVQTASLTSHSETVHEVVFLPVTVAMLDPMAKDCVVAPAASEALVSNWRYSRASAYSLDTHTHTHTHTHHV